jgi:hypothetical protein
MDNTSDPARRFGGLDPPAVATTLEATPRRSALRMAPVVVTGAYAWSVSVFPLAEQQGWMSSAGWAALGALLSLGLSLLAPSKILSLVCALHGFLLGCMLCFWWSSGALALTSWAKYGALGWLSYTIALGALSTPQPSPNQQASMDSSYLPRVKPNRGAAAAVLFAVLGSLWLASRAFELERPELAILAQLCALLIGVVLLRGAVRLAHLSPRALGPTTWAPMDWVTVALLVGLTMLLVGGLATGWAAR